MVPGDGRPLPKSRGGTTLRRPVDFWTTGPSLGAGTPPHPPPHQASSPSPLSSDAVPTHQEPDSTEVPGGAAPLCQVSSHCKEPRIDPDIWAVRNLRKERLAHPPACSPSGCPRTIAPAPSPQMETHCTGFSCRRKPQKKGTSEENKIWLEFVEITQLLMSPKILKSKVPLRSIIQSILCPRGITNLKHLALMSAFSPRVSKVCKRQPRGVFPI